MSSSDGHECIEQTEMIVNTQWLQTFVSWDPSFLDDRVTGKQSHKNYRYDMNAYNLYLRV